MLRDTVYLQLCYVDERSMYSVTNEDDHDL